MSARSKVALFATIALVVIGLLVFFLGPILFASVAYPLPTNFQEPIAKRAQQYGLNPNTLAALTFTESSFHQNDVSGAGALGPTQIEPATARGIASRLGVSPFSPSDLLTNVDLAEWFAAYYLSTDIKNYGSLHLALVAYNGGGGAANAAARGYGFPGPDSYASKVERIQAAYQAIYGSWWQSAQPTTAPATPAAPATVQFTVQPNYNFDVVTAVPVGNLWQNLLSGSSPADTPTTTPDTSGDINNLWKALIPNSQ